VTTNDKSTFEYWQASAEKIKPIGQAFISGKYTDSITGSVLDSISPIDSRILGQIANCDRLDVEYAVASSREAFERGCWSQAAPTERKKKLLRFADIIESNREELAILETLDMGKPISDALNIDIPSVVNTIRWYAELIDKVYGEIAPTEVDALALITREPIGVIAAVVPWNFPLLMASWKFAPALAAGNSVIIKPAEQSSLTIIRVAQFAIEAGIPAGVLNVVPGSGEVAGRALGLHGDVDALAFTGSTEVGKYFLQYSGQSNMKPVSLECGGKSPNIVFSDAADLNTTAKAIAAGIFFNQGEICNAGSRLIVHEDIKDELLERVVLESKNYQPGNPLDPATTLGAMVDEQQTQRVMSFVTQGKEEGASLVLGGKRVNPVENGCYIEATIFDNVTPEMSISQEEIFGPVLSITDFKTTEQAIDIANSTVFGLAAGVWSQNIVTAHSVSKRIKAGSIYVNCYDHSNMAVPFGGYKQSGFGRDKSIHALEKYTQLKSTWIDLTPA